VNFLPNVSESLDLIEANKIKWLSLVDEYEDRMKIEKQKLDEGSKKNLN
jgi:hypothetical protein